MLADHPLIGWLAALVVGGAVIFPALEKPPKDGFPLSTYPMFSDGRKSPTVVVEHAMAIDDAGRDLPIPPRHVANEEVLQAKATVARAARAGKEEALTLCREIAGRLVTARGFEAARFVELRTTRHDAVAYLTERGEAVPEPLGVRVHARCPVERP